MLVFNSCADHTTIVLDPIERDIVQSVLEQMVFADGAHDRAYQVADETGVPPLGVISTAAELADQLMYASCVPNYNNEEEQEEQHKLSTGNGTGRPN